MTRTTYRQCKDTGKLLTLEDWYEKHGTPNRAGYNIQAGFDDFKSPIDGKIITDRKQLREHNKQHGVTNTSDYSDGYVEKRALARNAAGEKYLKETRRKDINEAIQRHS